MNKQRSAYFKYIAATLAIVGAALTVHAQKLGDVQENSLLAPEKVKVDGKAQEWNNAFQAYNKSTLVYYTLANDDKNLYLVIQSTAAAITNKIMRGGVTFTINTSGKKKDKDGFAITFPVTAPTNMQTMMQSMTGGAGFGQMDPEQMMKRSDSVMDAANRKQIAALTEIKVLGFKDIPDSLISVYNTYGIKAAALFDNKGALTYELSVPLQSLGLSAGSPKEFAYNVKLNGMQITGFPGGGGNMVAGGLGGGGFGGPGGGGGGGFGGGPGGGGFGGGGAVSMPGGSRMADMMGMMSPTDFWAKYIPAKK